MLLQQMNHVIFFALFSSYQLKKCQSTKTYQFVQNQAGSAKEIDLTMFSQQQFVQER